MRAFGKVLLVLLVLVVVAVATDRIVVTIAERRVSDQVSAALDAPATVDLGGTLPGLRLLTGSIPRVDVAAREVPLTEGVELQRLDARLTGVRVSWRYLRERQETLPPADEGTFRAQIDVASLADLLPVPGRLEAVDGQRLRLSVANVASVEATLDAEDGRVVVRPQSPLAAFLGLERFDVDLSDQEGRPHVEEVVIRGDALVLRGRLLEVHEDEQ